MSRRLSNIGWRAVKQSYDRLKYKAVGAILEHPTALADFWEPILPGVGPNVSPVRVLHPNGNLKEEVPATEWRRRHGNPFRTKRRSHDASEIRRAV